ncbi:LysR family transcriptional regulator [Cognatishimia sp. 1_MG-2023]|uniref:LysR family transcriptional regulator n=1 Tax=Cognatishimia sp. 1_MG-2023 TaxID=3062642 RepID=UPI0026E48258|nr:LysR family transcriptional regulator [Cognatishimia sp. 1_MG-2023]MDO6728220.1 LysR family transcriptional regulator [Cognatishimia sp. 1_MG-2023]
MSFTLRQLRYFVSAAETGKLSTAATDCNVTQSAITLAIKGLEDQIGFELFERTSSGVILSLEGQRFLAKAREILSLVSSATKEPLGPAVGENFSGTIRVAATDTVMGYFLMPHLARFKHRYPGIQVETVEMARPKIEARLIDGSLDIAVLLVSNMQRTGELASSILLPSQRRLWLPSRHPLLARQSIRLRDIAKEPLIMLTVDEAADTAVNYWQHSDLQPNIVMKSANVEAVRTAVASGLGITILSDMVYRTWSLEGDRIEMRDIKDPVPSMDIGLAWRLGLTMPPILREFHTFLQSAYRSGAR